jgi:hypothetical protein
MALILAEGVLLALAEGIVLLVPAEGIPKTPVMLESARAVKRIADFVMIILRRECGWFIISSD